MYVYSMISFVHYAHVLLTAGVGTQIDPGVVKWGGKGACCLPNPLDGNTWNPGLKYPVSQVHSSEWATVHYKCFSMYI